jgi:hypothetical protein
MIFDDDPESKLSQMGDPDFFQIVKESNCQVAIGNQLFKIRDISGPKLKGSMKIFKFSTDHMCTVHHINRAAPGIPDLLRTFRMIEPKVFKPKDVSFGNIGAYLNIAWQVIRSNPSKRQYHSEGENTGPSNKVKNQSIYSRSGLSCMLLQV